MFNLNLLYRNLTWSGKPSCLNSGIIPGKLHYKILGAILQYEGARQEAYSRACLGNVDFGLNWRNAVIVSQVLDRNDLRRLYRKFGRYRLYRIARALPRSPWLADLPRVGSKWILEKLQSLQKRLT